MHQLQITEESFILKKLLHPEHLRTVQQGCNEIPIRLIL
jgi:hypothetical protein